MSPGNPKSTKMKIMKFYNISLNKIRLFTSLLLCILMAGTMSAQVPKEKKVREKAEVTLKVTDEEGNAIPNVQIIVGEGVIYTETDSNGSISFEAYPEDIVTISKSAFEKRVSLVADLINDNNIKLIKSKLYMTSDDNVPLPFTTLKKRNLTGSSNVLRSNQLEKYPSTDIRNSLTGLSTGLEVIEKNGAPGLTPEENLDVFGITQKINVSVRGFSMLCIIDDVPTDVTEMPLDPQEIESVTIIKDIIGKAMYGPIGANGIIFIKTKRGNKNERNLNVNIEGGVSTIDRMPGWVSGSDYATLNNLARLNVGEIPLYSESDISALGNNDPYDMYHPNTDFRKMMLKNTKPYKRVNVSSSGGNDIVQYSAYLGYTGEDDIYKSGAKSDNNQINTRSNLDVKINNNLKIQVDIYAGLSYRRSPNYGYDPQYTSEGSDNPVLSIIELPSVLSDITSIPPNAFPLYAAYDSLTNIPWFGVSSTYPVNPIGNLTNNGYYTEKGRTGAINFVLDYNPGSIKGLNLRTKLSFNALDLIRIGKAEDYIAYIASPSITTAGLDTILLNKVHDGVDMPGLTKLHDYYYQQFSFFENLSYERTFGSHNIQSTLTYFLYKISKNGIEEPQRLQTGVWTGMYSFNDKYSIQGVLNYSGTYSFAKDKRWGMFPSVGASWIISEESFMKDIKFLDYLKLRFNTGTLGYESFLSSVYFRSDWNTDTDGTDFGPYSTFPWFGSTMDATVYRTSPNRIGNPGLTWEKRKEFSAGFDALLLSQKLSIEISYYNNLRDGEITQLSNSTPYVTGISGALPRYNLTTTRYFGLETGIQFTNKAGEIFYSLGGNATIQNSEYVDIDEPNYRSGYQSRVGKPVDAYFGQTYLGKFATDEEALLIPQRFDDVLHSGDLKYADINNDDIVDDNDQSMIGHTTPRLFYALNTKIRFKNFEFTAIGTGRAFYDIPLTNKYFWNGWGNNNYSGFVKDNIDEAYPRLTYYKVNNNFVSSDFWLAKGDYFKIQNIELAYNFPEKISRLIGGRLIRIYIRGANLHTFSKIKEVDPESINSGVTLYPLYKTFSGGINFNF